MLLLALACWWLFVAIVEIWAHNRKKKKKKTEIYEWRLEALTSDMSDGKYCINPIDNLIRIYIQQLEKKNQKENKLKRWNKQKRHTAISRNGKLRSATFKLFILHIRTNELNFLFRSF